MSQENVEVVRRGLAAFNRRDEAAWIAVCDPEVENFPPREWPESAPTHGAENIWEFFVESVGAWNEGAFDWVEIIDAKPGKVMANQRRQMHGKASGAEVVWSYWVVFTFRSGKILRFEWFAERADALEAAGLSA